MEQSENYQAAHTRTTQGRLPDWILLVAGLGVIFAVLMVSPGGLLDYADHVGYAVCHQIPLRSYFFAGRQLPLCARCSGQFLGALFGLGALLLLRRGRAGLLPPAGIAILLLGFIALWAFDGFNSYLTLFPNMPHLYEPRNLLRVTTGAMQGVALIALVLPFFNSTFWTSTKPQPTVSRVREVGLLLILVAIIVGLVSSEVDGFLYPLAILSVAGTLMMLTLVNTMIVLLALRREATVDTWKQAIPVLVAGLALATVELLIINLVRASLTSLLGLPF